MALVLALDAGTTGVRTLSVDAHGRLCDLAYRSLTQHFPASGWVEHDPAEILAAALDTLAEVGQAVAARGEVIAAIGITNQRETTVAFDRSTGLATHRAIVWQDRRTAARCEELRAQGHEDAVRARTGLLLDPYFSATKMAWLLDHGAGDGVEDLALGTIDGFLLFHLTGGVQGGRFATDASNASRTLLLDLATLAYSPEQLELFDLPASALAEVVPTAGRLGTIHPAVLPTLAGTAVSAMVGDQQGALFGQACFTPGMVKATYGTGSFVLGNVGPTPPPPAAGLTTSVAWWLGGNEVTYALEGSAFVAGAAVQWLRDELGLLSRADELEPLARSCPDNGGLRLIPAFTGLGSPWFDPSARGVLAGITRGTGRAQLARATIEALACQVTAMVEAMAAAGSPPLTRLRVDGGAAAMDLLAELQADQLGAIVERPTSVESTALGAAGLAALAEGLVSIDDLEQRWSLDRRFEPQSDRQSVRMIYDGWCSAVASSRGLAP